MRDYCCKQLKCAYELKMIYPVAGDSLTGYLRQNPPVVKRGLCRLCDEEATIEKVLSINFCPFCGTLVDTDLIAVREGRLRPWPGDTELLASARR